MLYFIQKCHKWILSSLFAGELINNQDSNEAFRSAIGSFTGFVTGTLMKLGISIVMGYYFITALW